MSIGFIFFVTVLHALAKLISLGEQFGAIASFPALHQA